MWMTIRLVAVWTLSVVLGIGLVVSDVDRVHLAPGVVTQFEAFGYNLLFARLVGVYEILGGLSLIVPKMSVYGAVALSALMGGAIYTFAVLASLVFLGSVVRPLWLYPLQLGFSAISVQTSRNHSAGDTLRRLMGMLACNEGDPEGVTFRKLPGGAITRP